MQLKEMLGHRVSLTGLSTPGWTDQRGRVIGKREARFLVGLSELTASEALDV